MELLPLFLSRDRLFSLVLLEAVWELLSSCVKEVVTKLPETISPKVPELLRASLDQFSSTVACIDADSELHRFIASGITTIKSKIYKELKSKTDSKNKEIAKKGGGTTTKVKRLTKRIQSNAAILHLLSKMRILRKNLPSRRDKCYDSDTMKALDCGGLSYVSPCFLEWAKELMKKIRGSITQRCIKRSGMFIQKKAYDLVTNDKSLVILFQNALGRLDHPPPEEAAEFVRRTVVNYAFHARSEVEWVKYRALNTDRCAGVNKKLHLRDQLKCKGGS
jgi:hypothetical protein